MYAFALPTLPPAILRSEGLRPVAAEGAGLEGTPISDTFSSPAITHLISLERRAYEIHAHISEPAAALTRVDELASIRVPHDFHLPISVVTSQRLMHYDHHIASSFSYTQLLPWTYLQGPDRRSRSPASGHTLAYILSHQDPEEFVTSLYHAAESYALEHHTVYFASSYTILDEVKWHDAWRYSLY